MKIMPVHLFPYLIFAGLALVSEMGSQAAQASERVIAENVPECQHVGDEIEALALIDAGKAGNEYGLAVSSETRNVNVTSELEKGHGAPTAVMFRGEKFGEDIVTLSVPDRPDITPFTATIRVLPSFDPPQGLTTHPTENFSHIDPDADHDPSRALREIIFRWRHKDGVKVYGIHSFNSQKRETHVFIAPDGKNSALEKAGPGQSHFWSMQAKIDTCAGVEVWTPSSPLIPFDS